MEIKKLNEIILYSENILINFKNELTKLANELGYECFRDKQCRTDINFIKTIKDYVSKNKDNNLDKYIEVAEINTDRKWTIVYNSTPIDKNNHYFKESIAYLNSHYQDSNSLNLDNNSFS